jgi:hypothetical protein
MSNDKFPYPKGSEWRKWDLHVHSPESDGFSGSFEDFKNQIKRADCYVIGINDYFSVEGYKQIKQEIKEGKFDIGNKKLLPVVEFRMRDVLKNRHTDQSGINLNFHIVFSDKADIEDIETFLKSLKVDGQQISGKYTDKKYLKETAKIYFENDVINELKSNEKLKDKFLVWLPYDEYGGIDEIDPNSDDWIKRGFIKKSNIVGSSTPNQIEFFLWKSPKKENGENKYSQEQFKEWFCKKKPCIKGSDSHDKDFPVGKLRDSDSKPTEKYCWIKADPTFEGLKQIIYEPDDRVKIQGLKPEKKTPYLVIDKVRFIDNTGKNNFPSDYIDLNQNLTSIIGGKSTGKSLLLYYIAKTIDNNEVDKRLQKINGNSYAFEENTDFNFEVMWQDGEKSFLQDISEIPVELLDEETPLSKRKIVYIPQNYLNKLSEKDIKTKETLNEFVLQVLIQEPKAKNQYEFSLNRISEIEKEISIKVNELFSIEKEKNEVNQQAKSIGDEKGITKYIDKIAKEIEEIKSKSGLTQGEIKQYGELTEKETKYKNNLTNLNNDRVRILNLSKALSSGLESINTIKEEHQEYIINKDIKEKVSNELKFLTNYKDNVNLAIANIIKEVDSQIKLNQTELLKITKALEPLISKIKLQEGLKEKSKSLKLEEKKLNKIRQLQNELKLKEKSLTTRKDKILELYREIFNTYKGLQNEFKKYENKFEDILLNVVIRFKEKEFNEDVVNDFLNKKDLKPLLGSSGSEEFEYQYNPDSHLDNITKIFKGVLNSKVRTIGNKPRKDAILKVLEDKFYLDFNITYQNDPLDKMSPGKKGLVLLKLIIDLTKEEWPILLDQPDDDLDNRSVYSDLVAFIKRKKSKRQIIIITHNPNLVVGADAEEIIVANQSGQELGRDNRKFRFEYVSGALENSFEAEEADGILYKKGIREHACEVLEGGEEAFQKREQKYNFPK